MSAQDHARRAKLFERAAALKSRFDAAGLPRIDSVSHIVPLHIGEAALCTDVSQRLLNEFGMYATPINYPTVPRGEERLRFTPGPLHTDAMMDELVEALPRSCPEQRRASWRDAGSGAPRYAGASRRATARRSYCVNRRRQRTSTPERPLLRTHGGFRAVGPWRCGFRDGAPDLPMITELGHFALILALFVAIIQSTVPLLGQPGAMSAGWRSADPAR